MKFPIPLPDFFRFRIATFDLTLDEAEWLCERILSSDRSDGHASLMSAYIRDLGRGEEPPDVDAIWDAALPADTPVPITRLVHHAQQLSCAAHGAALLYNLMLAEERPSALESKDATSVDTYRAWLDEWTADATRVRLAEWAAGLDDFWNCILDNAARIPRETRFFLDGWSNLLAAGPRRIASSNEARELIRAREIQHKRGQARLANKKRLAEWSGYAGTTPLAFRWPQVQRMLGDIAAGLGEEQAGGDHAVA